MSSDLWFTATGPAFVGFGANSTSIAIGADITGIERGITGRCAGPVGDGVQGYGSGNFSGVAGFGANLADGAASPGTGVYGQGGAGNISISGAPGVRGIGGGGPNTTDPFGRAVGVYGQGGPGGPGVVGSSRGNEFPAPGVAGFGTGGSFGVAGNGGAGSGALADGHGVEGIGGGTTGLGVVGTGAGAVLNIPSSPVGVFGQAGPPTAGAISGADGVQGVGSGTGGAGVHGISLDTDGNGIIGEANNGSLAYGVWGSSSTGFAGFFDGRVHVSGSLDVTGAKSSVVPFADGSHRRLYCLESPESWFEDFGVAHFENGQGQVQLDADFAAVVKSDTYHVFLTEYEDNNALYVVNRTNTGFGVRAKSSNTSKGTFSYRIVAKRKDIEGARLEKVTIPTGKLKPAEPRFTTLPPASERSKH